MIRNLTVGKEDTDMSMMEAVSSVFRNFANFNGRARRSEYWFYYLFNFLLGFVLGLLSFFTLGATTILVFVYSLVVLIPGLAVTCRRLHDIGRSGAYQLFYLIPVVGWVFMLIWTIQDSTPGPNMYGPDPKAGYRMYAGPQTYRAPAQNGGRIPAQNSNRVPALRAENGAFSGKSFLVQGKLTMGRAMENMVVFPSSDAKVSRMHCEFTSSGGRLYVRDLGSSNGTIVNGSYRLLNGQSMELKTGDRISIGSQSETFTVI